jgi:hypothetical protein
MFDGDEKTQVVLVSSDKVEVFVAHKVLGIIAVLLVGLQDFLVLDVVRLQLALLGQL